VTPLLAWNHVQILFTSVILSRFLSHSSTSSINCAENFFSAFVYVRSCEIKLINSKCLSCLLYATEACPVNKTQERSLEFTVNKVLCEGLQNHLLLWTCLKNVNSGISDIQVSIAGRKLNFLRKFTQSNNALCWMFVEFARTWVWHLLVCVHRM